jgi:hypothetical protein
LPATVVGGRWQAEHHDFKNLPLLVRPGTLLAVGAVAERPDYAFADGVTIEAYKLGEGEFGVDVPDGTGTDGASAIPDPRGLILAPGPGARLATCQDSEGSTSSWNSRRGSRSNG